MAAAVWMVRLLDKMFLSLNGNGTTSLETLPGYA